MCCWHAPPLQVLLTVVLKIESESAKYWPEMCDMTDRPISWGLTIKIDSLKAPRSFLLSDYWSFGHPVDLKPLIKWLEPLQPIMIAFLSLRWIMSLWRWTALWEHLTYMWQDCEEEIKWVYSVLFRIEKINSQHSLKQIRSKVQDVICLNKLPSFPHSSATDPESLLTQCGSFLQ